MGVNSTDLCDLHVVWSCLICFKVNTTPIFAFSLHHGNKKIVIFVFISNPACQLSGLIGIFFLKDVYRIQSVELASLLSDRRVSTTGVSPKVKSALTVDMSMPDVYQVWPSFSAQSD